MASVLSQAGKRRKCQRRFFQEFPQLEGRLGIWDRCGVGSVEHSFLEFCSNNIFYSIHFFQFYPYKK